MASCRGSVVPVRTWRTSSAGTAYAAARRSSYSVAGRLAAQEHRQGPLAGGRVGRDVAQVVDHEDRRDERARRDRRDEEEGLESQRLEVRRPDDGDEPEEDVDEDLAEGVVAVREGPARVGEGRDDRERPEREDHRPADEDQPEPDQPGERR